MIIPPESLTEDVIRGISAKKNEPEFMLELIKRRRPDVRTGSGSRVPDGLPAIDSSGL